MRRTNLFGPPPAPPPDADAHRRRWMLGLGAALMFWAAIVLPDAAGAAQRALELRTLHDQEREAEGAQAALRATTTELEQYGKTGTGVSTGGLPALLGVLRVSAEESGARLDRVEPEAEEERGGQNVVPVRVLVSGDGHAVGRFVDAVERSGFVVPVRHLSVTGSRDERVAAAIDLVVSSGAGGRE